MALGDLLLLLWLVYQMIQNRGLMVRKIVINIDQTGQIIYCMPTELLKVFPLLISQQVCVVLVFAERVQHMPSTPTERLLQLGRG